MKHRVEYSENMSHKFWEVEVKDRKVVTRWGAIDAAPAMKVKTHETPESALKDAEKQLKAKLKKGYKEAKLPGG